VTLHRLATFATTAMLLFTGAAVLAPAANAAPAARPVPVTTVVNTGGRIVATVTLPTRAGVTSP
jgi:hypothetical protein